MRKFLFHIAILLITASCAAQKKVARSPDLNSFFNDTAIRNAHVGISVYDAAAGRYLYDHQSDKYFVPASNTKIVTCYAAMKYLKHILTGIRYYENDTAVYLVPTGDPTFLHRDYPLQPVFNFLQQQQKKIYITDQNWKDKELGKGWSWDDYSDEYMTERNALPVYGNTIKWIQTEIISKEAGMEESFSMYSDPEVNWKVRFEPDPVKKEFKVRRDRLSNMFTITEGTEPYEEVLVPFITNGIATSLELLADTVRKEIGVINNFVVTDPQRHSVPSQPVDSVLKPMMYRSDNFFAEQLLLMVAEERFGVLDSELLIDTLLKTDLAGLPQKPVWVDGSGLSRYNLFSPRDFVTILDSMRLQFGMERLKTIFPMGDSGTLKGYYMHYNPYIYAKTGSMSGVVAISGFLFTQSGRTLIFSVMVNNFSGKTVGVRRAIERLLKELWQKGSLN